MNWNNNRQGSYGGGRNTRTTMHRATCDKCNASCELPFKPNGSKPVYCSNCFEKQGSGGSGRRNDSSGYKSRDSYDKPSYKSAPSANNDEVVKQLKHLNTTMSEILRVLKATDVQAVDEDVQAVGEDADDSFTIKF